MSACFCACIGGTDAHSKANVIYVDLSAAKDYYDLSPDIADEIVVTPLETDERCMVGDIRRVIFANGRYYIQDRASSAVFIFDESGKFINKLSRLGRAPNEYLSLISFTVVGDNIWIIDNNGNMVKCYDSNCEYVSGFRFFPTACEIESLGDDIFISTNRFGYAEVNYELYRYNTQTKETTSYFPYPATDPNTIRISRNLQFARQPGSLLFIHPQYDTIYQINSDGVEPRYKFAFSERYDNTLVSYNDFNTETYWNVIHGLDGVRQTSNSVILEFNLDKRAKCAIYNKRTKECRAYNESIRISSIGDIRVFDYFIQEDELIACYPLMYLHSPGFFDVEKVHDEGLKQKFSEILAARDENDNPIIVRFKLKRESGL